MDFNSFLEKFNNSLLEDAAINADTDFRKLGSWDSLSGMAVIVMIEDEYGVAIDDRTFKTLTTVGDIYNYVSSHVA